MIPRIVAEDDVLAANSAVWTADTLADILGFPLAGLFVAFLGANAASLSLAFFADSATYVLSAVLLAAISVAPIVRDLTPRVGSALRKFSGELADGWRFLRGKPALIQNTLISTVAQMSVGVTLALTVVYARDVLTGQYIPYPGNYAAIETAIGVGSLVGGIAVGAFGSRTRKGWLVVGGFIAMGLATVVFGLTGNVLVALAAAVIVGIANLVFIIPTQTIFIQMTPIELMGRVVAFRGSPGVRGDDAGHGPRGHPGGEHLGGDRDRGFWGADCVRRADRGSPSRRSRRELSRRGRPADIIGGHC